MRQLELLAPARDLECGKAAIDHGADAVYIGADRFGARAAAANSVRDVAQLCRHAHRFGAKVYAAVNTIVYEDELAKVHQLIDRLADAGVDAVLVQDMALVGHLCGSPMALHASTQTDNRTAEKVAWLRSVGFSRAVLARELTLGEIAGIHARVPDMELEVFVHGALCVSYSGLCYASQHCFGRSANRGECAQFCRLRFDLEDADGNTVSKGKYFLSLRDLNLSGHIEQLAAAGATSFKIEGRLKGADYVKNVTAAYSQLLDDVVRRNPSLYCRASRGVCHYDFTPDLSKTFNRGFTSYFVDGRQHGIASFATPKAMGEPVGTVRAVGRGFIDVDGHATFANGDGLCFVDGNEGLVGFRVNRAEGHRLFLQRVPQGLHAGQRLFRNSDAAFSRTLSRRSAERKLPVDFSLRPTATGIALRAAIEGWHAVEVEIDMAHEEAQTPQSENIRRQLSRLGGTAYECRGVSLSEGFDLFVPSSVLSTLRRMAVDALDAAADGRPGQVCRHAGQGGAEVPRYCRHSYLYNISNSEANDFYGSHGLADASPAYELRADAAGPIMQCRHCLRFELGFCQRHGGSSPTWKEPLRLALPDGRRFRLAFDCQRCQMLVFADGNTEKRKGGMA